MIEIRTKEQLQSIGVYGLKGVCDAQTVPNANIPENLLQIVDPKIIRVLNSPLTYNAIADDKFVGQFGHESYRATIIEGSGEAVTYHDKSNDGSSGINVNSEYRDPYRWQDMLTYGELEVEQGSLRNINIINEKRETALYTIRAKANKIAFFGAVGYGFTGLRNYGIINEPSLRTVLTATKPWNDNTKTFNEIVDDIGSMMDDILDASQGNVTETNAFRLAIPYKVWSSLNLRLSSQDRNVKQLLNSVFGSGLEIVTAPELGYAGPKSNAPATDGGRALLMAVDGGSPFEFVINERMKISRVKEDTTSSEQKMMASAFGTVLKKPWAVSTLTGVLE